MTRDLQPCGTMAGARRHTKAKEDACDACREARRIYRHEWSEKLRLKGRDKKPSVRERLLSKAVINWETGCWEWAASKNSDGYGQFRFNDKMAKAYRVAYELIEGPIPAGLQLDHLCRNRACINPAHLEPVTPAENTLRGVSPTALNAAKTHCPAGHEYTPENTLTYCGVRRCRACHSAQQSTYRRQRRTAPTIVLEV